MSDKLLVDSLYSWLKTDNQPVIICGPCSADSEEQVLQTARELTKIDAVKLFRAGI
ncbi:MAG: hypothetical protein PF484_04885 [Bacteroidales bacterium]|jgi:chorismate mutase|nr:hypothetical protein [Bacteroidales bacterium]